MLIQVEKSKIEKPFKGNDRYVSFGCSLLLLFFSSCATDWTDKKVIETEVLDNLRGSYKITIIAGNEASNKMSDQLLSLFQMNATFKDESNVIVEGMGKKKEALWKMENDSLILNYSDGRKVTFVLSNFIGNYNSFTASLPPDDEAFKNTNIKGYLFTKLGSSN